MRKSLLNLRKRLSLVVLILAVSASGTFGSMGEVHAYEEKSATIKGSLVNVREEPNTSSAIVSKLPEGRELTIINEVSMPDGYIWYQVTYLSLGEQKTGYVRSDLVNIISGTGSDTSSGSGNSGVKDPYEGIDFETYLTQQGFPETYKVKLRELHKKYPYWKFEAQQTGLDWNTVITEESKLGRNTTQNTNPSSWKSTQTGAYNWDTSTWIELDSGGWVAASPEIIAYYMDPRNFLDETYIFQFLRQSYDSTQQTKEGVGQVTKGTFLAGTYSEGGTTKSYADTLITAAEQSGVSPYTLASMIIVEQGTSGSGKCISGTVSGYEGYYNYFNIGAYATSSMTAVQRGLWYAKGSGVGATSYNRPWNTRTKSIIGGAINYGTNYVKVGQDTLYLKKYNVQGSNLYNHQYMTNVQGAATEASRMSKAFTSDAKQSNLTFKIPVYKNMPSSACAKPTGDGSPNYMLKTLAVSGQSLTPTFDMYTTSYSLIVDHTVSSVTVSATALDSKATVSGNGNVNLNVGTNKVTVTVKAQNGQTRSYTITIVREEAPAVSDTDPVLASSVYTVDTATKCIAGVKTFPVSAQNFSGNLKVSNGSIKIQTAAGATQSGNVGTGNLVKVYDAKGTLKETYTVILYGDTNGDGKIDALDLLRVQKDILGASKLSGANKTAADTSRDGNINALDLLQVQKQILGAGTIKQ